MPKLSIRTVTALLESPAFVDGLSILYGSTAQAARKLGISAKRLASVRERFYEPSDSMILSVQKGLSKLSTKEVKVIESFAQIGDKFSPWQIKALERKSKRDSSFRGEFAREIVSQAKRYEIDFLKLIGSPKSKGTKKR